MVFVIGKDKILADVSCNGERSRTFSCDFFDYLDENGFKRRCRHELWFAFTMKKNGEWSISDFWYIASEDCTPGREWSAEDKKDYIENMTYCSKEYLEEIMKNVYEHYEEIRKEK